jgi:hypothetical protein
MHVLRGGRAGRERWLGLVVLLPLLGSLVISSACGDASETGEAGEYSDAGGATAPAPGEAGELGGPGGAGGGSTEVPPNAAPGEAGELGGPGGDSDPPDAGPGEAGELGGPGSPTTIPPDGVDDGHIWVPGCDVYVTERIEAGQYAELRGDLECILNDPTAPPDVLEAAREADALAQERLAERETDSGTTSPPEPDSDSAG